MANDLNQPQTQPRLLSVEETRIALGGIGRTQVWKLHKAGELTSVRIGKRLFFTVASIDAYVDRLSAAAVA